MSEAREVRSYIGWEGSLSSRRLLGHFSRSSVRLLWVYLGIAMFQVISLIYFAHGG